MTIRLKNSQIPSSLESLLLEKGKTLFLLMPCASLWSMTTMVLVFMELLFKLLVSSKKKRRKNKLAKETEGKVSGVKSEGQMSRGRNRFSTEFLTDLGEGFILIKKKNQQQRIEQENIEFQVQSLDFQCFLSIQDILLLPNALCFSKAAALLVSQESKP